MTSSYPPSSALVRARLSIPPCRPPFSLCCCCCACVCCHHYWRRTGRALLFTPARRSFACPSSGATVDDVETSATAWHHPLPPAFRPHPAHCIARSQDRRGPPRAAPLPPPGTLSGQLLLWEVVAQVTSRRAASLLAVPRWGTGRARLESNHPLTSVPVCIRPRPSTPRNAGHRTSTLVSRSSSSTPSATRRPRTPPPD